MTGQENTSLEMTLKKTSHTCKHRIQKLHILSKLLNICQKERISTKLTLPIHRSPVFGLFCSIVNINHEILDTQNFRKVNGTLLSNVYHDLLNYNLKFKKLYVPLTDIMNSLSQLIELQFDIKHLLNKFMFHKT